MTPEQFKAGRATAGFTQQEAAMRLGLSQPYLSQLETGQRPLTRKLARTAATLYRLPPTALPIPAEMPENGAGGADRLARELSGLGYPGFAHLRARKANPAAVVLEALLQSDLEVRVIEALPWVLLRYSDLDWAWLTRHARVRDAQNRLGFLVALARELAASRPEFRASHELLLSAELQLERARLAREDTLCRDSMPDAERRWLEMNRSALARHWNLLTGLISEQLPYAAS